eukprot:3580780-Amphidinium_carterae.1
MHSRIVISIEPKNDHGSVIVINLCATTNSTALSLATTSRVCTLRGGVSIALLRLNCELGNVALLDSLLLLL